MRSSVALCTYKGERFLSEQLQSIAAQTTKPDELVIVDDNSSDGTLSIAREFARTAPFATKVLANTENLGPALNFTRAMQECQEPIVFFSDQDDVWMPDKMQKFLTLFEDPVVLAVASNAAVVKSDLSPTGRRLWQSIGFGGGGISTPAPPVLLDHLLRRGNFIAGMCFAVRRDFALTQLPFPKGWLHDGWLGLMAALQGGLRLIDEDLALYRQHESNVVGVPRLSKLQIARLLAGEPRIDLHDSYDQTESAIERLGNRISADQVAYLTKRLAHLDARLKLSPRRALRVPTILSQLISGNYSEYSAGLFGAGRDILRSIYTK